MHDDGGDRAPSDTERLAQLVQRADPAPLLIEVEQACARRDWGHLFVLRDRCQSAAEALGKQLWPVAQYAEYRLALEAPAALACRVVRPGAATFALGPLTEVVAAGHPWEELAGHLDLPFIAATVAQERVVRGEDLRGDPRACADELELPLTLADWEPDYPLPTYRHDALLEGGVAAPAGAWSTQTPAGAAAPTPWERPAAAVAELVGHWETASSGAVHVATLRGAAPGAVGALVPGSFELVALRLDEALARLVWAGASAGARGRRRGLAAGRSAAWWLLHQLTGQAWPADPGALGEAAGTLGWYAYREGGDDPGWSLRLAIESADRSRTLVVDATDRRTDQDAAADAYPPRMRTPPPPPRDESCDEHT